MLNLSKFLNPYSLCGLEVPSLDKDEKTVATSGP